MWGIGHGVCRKLGNMGYGGLGLVKQTGIYFLIDSVTMMPIAYVTFWMEHSLKGVLSYFGIFALMFAVVWIV